MKNRRNIKIKQMVSLMIILILVLSLTGCSTVNTSFNNFKAKYFPEEKLDVIKIAVFEPMTGEFSSSGQIEINGIKLANSVKPQVLGKDVELVYLDNRSDMYEGEEILNNMLTTQFTGVIGSYGDILTLVCGNKVKELSIPGMATTCVNSLLTVNNPYYFTVSYNEDNQGEVLGKYIANNKGAAKVAVVRIKSDETVDIVIDGFMTAIQSNPLVTATVTKVELEQTTYQDEILEMKKNGITDVLLLLPLKSSQDFMKQCRTLEFNPSFSGTKTLDNSDMMLFIENNGVDCIYCTDVMETDDNLGEDFSKAYKDMFSEEPETTAAAISYDAYMILLKAIEDAYNKTGSIDGTSVKNAISSITEYNGVSGNISYGGSNVARKPISVKHITPQISITEEIESTSDMSKDIQNEEEINTNEEGEGE